MKFIKIFLASSVVEFKKERLELKAFINSLNNICVKKGVFFEMKICEELSSALAMERKQNEYNEYIRGCDYLFLLFGRSIGKYTIEEFDVALEHFKAKGTPKIFVYFKQPAEELLDIEASETDFMARLEGEPQVCCSRVIHMSDMKRELLEILSADKRVDMILAPQTI